MAAERNGAFSGGRRHPHAGTFMTSIAVAGVTRGDTMFERVFMLADLPPGTMRCVTVRGRDILIANAGGAVLATDDACTHEDASLSCGVLVGEIVRCPLHGATFSLRDGAPLDEPAEEPLRCHEVRIEDGAVLVRVSRK